MKTWKTLGLLTLLFSASLSLQAQDIVKLKDGSFIRGTIIEYIAGDHVRIKTEEGKVYEYPADAIARTDVGNAGTGRSASILVPKTKGFYNITGLGLNMGNYYGRLRTNPGLYTVNGWQWTPHLMTGIGAGVEYLYDAVTVPLTADVRWKFGKGNVSAYVGASCGYTLSSKTDRGYYYDSYAHQINRNYGGITTGAKVGFMTQVAPHLGLDINAGFRFQKLRSEYDQPYWNGTTLLTMLIEEKTYLNRVTLGFGFLFN